jgi:hypothetical protein
MMMMNRCWALEQIFSGMALSLLPLSSSTTANAAATTTTTTDDDYHNDENDMKKKRILITGSNFGIEFMELCWYA